MAKKTIANIFKRYTATRRIPKEFQDYGQYPTRHTENPRVNITYFPYL